MLASYLSESSWAAFAARSMPSLLLEEDVLSELTCVAGSGEPEVLVSREGSRPAEWQPSRTPVSKKTPTLRCGARIRSLSVSFCFELNGYKADCITRLASRDPELIKQPGQRLQLCYRRDRTISSSLCLCALRFVSPSKRPRRIC